MNSPNEIYNPAATVAAREKHGREAGLRRNALEHSFR